MTQETYKPIVPEDMQLIGTETLRLPELYKALTGKDHLDYLEEGDSLGHPVTIDTAVNGGMDHAYVFVKKLQRAFESSQVVSKTKTVGDEMRLSDAERRTFQLYQMLKPELDRIESAYVSADAQSFGKALQDLVRDIFVINNC